MLIFLWIVNCIEVTTLTLGSRMYCVAKADENNITASKRSLTFSVAGANCR